MLQSEVRRLITTLSKTTWQKLLLYFMLYLLPVLLFAELADEVRERETLLFDSAILHWVHTTVSSPVMDRIVVTITDFGYVWWVGGLTIIGLLILLYYKQRRNALILALGVAGSAIINIILKLIFQRDRPQLWERIVVENSASFPSGHAMASASLALCAIVIFWPTRWRYPVLISGIIYMFVIAFTRLYLGVHYPTDIIAGWLMAIAWVLIVAGLARHWRIKKT